MSSIKRTTLITNFLWRFFERIGTHGVEFIVQIILARLLMPEDYGTIAIVLVFIEIANVFVTSSFGQALVQKIDANNKDFSSVFYFNIGLGILLYFVLFFSAPVVANFYDNIVLTPVIRVLALSLIVGSVFAIQQAYVQRMMQFKRFFYSTMIGTVISASVGIAMAYMGFGVWALVAQTLVNKLVNVIVLWVTVDWHPQWYFSIKRVKVLFSYGWKLLCAGMLDTIYNNLYSLIIGKKFTESELGEYKRGQQFPSAISMVISNSIQAVIFPALAAQQNDIAAVKQMVRRAIKISTFLIFPAMAGLAAVAESLVEILLTEKWLACVPFLQFACFIYAFWPIHTANLQAINAVGRSDIFLKLEIVKKIMGVVVLCITVPMGLYAMMWGSCISTVVSSFINASPNKNLLGYSYFEQMKDILPSMLLSFVMCGVVLCVNLLELNVWLTIIVQVVIGTVIYAAGAWVFKFESMKYILDMIKGFRKER